MANIFIYGGLGILLLGAVFGLGVAIRGYIANKGEDPVRQFWMNNQSMDPKMKRMLKIYGLIMVIGFILIGIGISFGLN